MGQHDTAALFFAKAINSLGWPYVDCSDTAKDYYKGIAGLPFQKWKIIVTCFEQHCQQDKLISFEIWTFSNLVFFQLFRTRVESELILFGDLARYLYENICIIKNQWVCM